MKYYIHDPQKKNYHLYEDLIIRRKLYFLNKLSDEKDLNVIFVASKLSDLYGYINLKKDNNVILIIENIHLLEKIVLAKNIAFYRLEDFLKRTF